MAIVPSGGISGAGELSAIERFRTMVHGPAAAGGPPAQQSTRLQGRNLIFGAGDNLTLSLPQLDADLIDLTPSDPLDISKRDGWRMHIRGGEVMLTDGQISSFLRAELGDMAKKVKDLQIRFLPNNKITVDAKLTGLNIKLHIEADMRLDENRMLAINATKVKIGPASILGVMSKLGFTIDKFVKPGDDGGRFGIKGNSIWLNPMKLSQAPVIDGEVNSINTQNGFLSIYFGNTSKTQPVWLPRDGNFATLTGGRIISDGLQVDDPRILLRDKTPQDPFDIDDSKGRTTTVNGGRVTLPTSELRTMIEGAIGDSDSFKLNDFAMTSKGARINGTLKGLIPIELYLRFSKTTEGELKIEPHGGKVGFIPLPSSLLRSVLGGMLKGARKDGDGFVMTKEMLGETQLGKLISVSNNNGSLQLQL